MKRAGRMNHAEYAKRTYPAKSAMGHDERAISVKNVKRVKRTKCAKCAKRAKCGECA